MFRRFGASLIVLLAFACGSALAAPVKVGPEFRVTATQHSQLRPSVAVLANGGFVITWDSAEQDGSGRGIYARIYTANGAHVGGAFLVNTTTANDQTSPFITRLSNGRFVIVWTAAGSGGSGQLYSAAGARVGGEFPIAGAPSSVAGLGDGGFVVTWPSSGSAAGQRFSAAGAPVGASFQLKPDRVPTGRQKPSVAALSNGGFVVVVSRYLCCGHGFTASGQVFSAAGAPVGDLFQITQVLKHNRVTYEGEPSVAGLNGGGFVVTWTTFFWSTWPCAIEGQRFTAAGVAIGSVFSVTPTASYQNLPRVATLSGGGFVVTWHCDLCGEPSGSGVFGQGFSAAATPVGGRFQINTLTAGNQIQPSVDGLRNGGFVVVWTSRNADRTSNTIFGQRYGP